MTPMRSRRRFLAQALCTFGSAALGSVYRAPRALAAHRHRETRRIYKSVKMGMFQEEITLGEKFRLLKELGYDGVELNSPGGVNKAEALAASRSTGLPIHGVVNSIHWHTRLSDPDPAVRLKAIRGLKTSITEAHFVGGSSVLLVPGKVTHPEKENQKQVWERSIAGIREALPVASKLGIRILIENVWNGFCYTPEGPENQTADLLAQYIDAIESPWVGVYFDVGNHQKYGSPPEWIRTLGRRIVKLDIKDWGKKSGFSKIGDGDVDWAQVRAALKEIGFTGWATAEVGGGDRGRLGEIAKRMDGALGL